MLVVDISPDYRRKRKSVKVQFADSVCLFCSIKYALTKVVIPKDIVPMWTEILHSAKNAHSAWRLSSYVFSVHVVSLKSV